MIQDPADPIVRAMNTRRRCVRDIDQLLGLCTGVMADGHVSQLEAEMLQAWIRKNYEIRDRWPANVLLSRLDAALEDGKLDSDEERDLLRAIIELTGGGRPAAEAFSAVATLPVNDPAPPVDFASRTFVVTGTFAYGPRKAVTTAIEDRGGAVKSAVSGKTNFLVIGDLGSTDWRHSSFGSKIQAAVDLREKGSPVAIVSEQHWFAHL